MTKLNEVYKCTICGNVVEIIHSGAGTLVCCGQDMVLQSENKVDASTEKHLPVISQIDSGYRIEVGEIEHPMTDEHHIEWIELIIDDEIYRQYLQPKDNPEAVFNTPHRGQVKARAYCNLHGLWLSE